MTASRFAYEAALTIVHRESDETVFEGSYGY